MASGIWAPSQFDGGHLAGLNCNCAVCAALIAFESGQKFKPTGSNVRAKVIDLRTGKPDTVGGTNPTQVALAAKSGWGVILDVRYAADPEEMWALGQRTDRAVAWSIHYDVIAPTRFDACHGFTGNHEVFLSGGLVYDPLADHRRSDVPQSPQAWPKELLLKAAARLDVSAPGQQYRPLGAGRAYVIIAEAPPSPTTPDKRYSALFDGGYSFFAYTVINGRIASREPIAYRKNTSAPVTKPEAIPWKLGSKNVPRRLVKVLKGGLAERWVEPGASHVLLEVA